MTKNQMELFTFVFCANFSPLVESHIACQEPGAVLLITQQTLQLQKTLNLQQMTLNEILTKPFICFLQITFLL